MITKGNVVKYGSDLYKVISITNKGGKDVLKLRSLDGRSIWYNVETEDVIKITNTEEIKNARK